MTVISATSYADQLKFFRIGTGSSSGSYFQMGSELSEILSNPIGSRPCEKGGRCGVPGLITITQTSEGSVENIHKIQNKVIDAALIQSNLAYLAYNSKGPFKNNPPSTELRSIIRLLRESLHIIVLEQSPIKSISDLKGKKISIGKKNSGSAMDSILILEKYGINPENTQIIYGDPGDSSDLLIQKKIDCFFAVLHAPSPAITDIISRQKVRFLGIEETKIDEILKNLTFFDKDTLGSNLYPGLNEVNTIASGSLLVTHKDLDEELIYDITKALIEYHFNSEENSSESVLQIDIKHRPDLYSIPLHDGALKLYKDMKIIN